MISESEFTVQGHGVHTAYIESANALRRRKDIELKVNSSDKNSFDIMHAHTVGFFAMRHLLSRNVKKVVTAHLVSDSFIGSLKGAAAWRPIAEWWLRLFYNRADLLLAVSDYTADELKKMRVKPRVEIVHNTIDTLKYKNSAGQKKAARQKLGLRQDAFIVIGSGQVQPRKRPDLFVKLAKKMKEVDFLWVGGLPFGKVASGNGSMQRLMKCSEDNMTFTGLVPLDEMADYYRAADVFVLPSDQETFGLVVVEAAASGLPVILRDISDYDKTFRGMALMARSDEEFGEIIEKLRTDKKLYQKSKELSVKLADRYDATKTSDQIVSLYRELIADK